MNRQIGRLSLFFTVLIVVLVGFTSWWSVIRADSLEDNTLNRRALLEQQQVPRGLVLANDDTKLAVNERSGRGEKKTYERSYPEGSLFSHEVGYSYISRGSAGLEQFYNGVLSGTEGDLRTFLDEIAGGPEQGDDIRTTLDPSVQQAASDALGARKGAIVVLDPEDGDVLAMVSKPDYDPNQVPEQFAELNRREDSPILNRATQGGYAPGSTMKVVTAAAALDTGKYTPGSQIDGQNNKLISGAPLANFGGQEYGSVSLTDALTNSVNTVFGEIGEKLGPDTMYRYMERFGFNEKPPLDYPRGSMLASGVYDEDGEIIGDQDSVDIGRVAIGQERLRVTPLQMAMVAAAVGNDGRLMRPHFLDKVIGPDGRTKDNFSPQEQSRVMSEQAASDLTGMMTNVVESGSGTAAQLEGLQVAGKTGTAETGTGDNAWFIAFAPAEDPEVAIAVVVEGEQQSQTGGEVAAPLAAQVMRVVLDG